MDPKATPPSGTTPPPLPSSKTHPWYFQTTWITFVALSIPPLALPQILWHPTLPGKWKLLYTIAILLITWLAWLLILHTISTFKTLLETLQNFQP